MRSLAWHGLLLLVSGWISWWVFLRVPPAPPSPGAREPAAVLNVLPLVRESAASATPSSRLASAAEPPPTPVQREPDAAPVPVQPPAAAEPTEPELAHAPAAPAPPPGELGTPEGSGDEAGLAVEEQPGEASLDEVLATQPIPTAAADEAAAETTTRVADEKADELVPPVLELPESASLETTERGAGTRPASPEIQPVSSPGEAPTLPPPARGAVEALMHDPALVATARAEFSSGNKRGFTTVLLAAPEEQIEIARFFGEELVLVPRAALDPGNPEPGYFRVADRGAAVVERVDGAPRLEDHRQYRDLFDYEYARLPAPLRELRRSLVARGEVYLFAALLSAEEWALVIARRREALARAGRELAEVRRFVLRYARLSGGGFDLRAEELVFADGSRFVPGVPGKGDG